MRTVMHMIETGGTGGAETVYVDLIRRLDPHRWNHVPVLPNREWMYEQLVALGLEPIVIRERHSLDLRFFGKLAMAIRRRGVDLLHAHLFGSAVHAALLSRLTGVPAIATLHGAMDVKSGERLLGVKVAAINHGLSKLVFVSEGVKRTLLDALPLRPELATVITNGIDVQRFSAGNGAGFRAELGIGADEFLVGTIATPGRPAKGLDVLLDAVAILKTASPGCRFVVIGDLDLGRGTEFIQERDERGLTSDVLLTGFRSDVNRVLAAFDLYALTSRSEGFPLSLLEAMAAGLPIVATRCGGPQEILQDGVSGILVENGSGQQIADTISALRHDMARRRRLSDAARAAVTERFTIDAEIQAYEKVYDSCLLPSKRPVRGEAVARLQHRES